MTGTITYILSRAGYRAMNGPLADERRRLEGAEPPAAYVSYDPRLLAGAGWYGYRIALKGGDRQMVERARYMLAELYVIRDGYEYYADGVYVFGVLLRERVPHYGIGGGAPAPEPDALNFYMPNGGTISLNKIGAPTVVELEYWLNDNGEWLIWQADNNGNRSLTLSAGQRVYIRNTSDTKTRFSLSNNRSNYYNFAFSDATYADGSVESLIKRNRNGISVLSEYDFSYLFYNCSKLVKAPYFITKILSNSSCEGTFYNCSNLVEIQELPFITINVSSCMQMFRGCSSLASISIPYLASANNYGLYEFCSNCKSLNTVVIGFTNISQSNALTRWLQGVANSGDFYCPAELTIPTGVNGIPSGWTRHDI